MQPLGGFVCPVKKDTQTHTVMKNRLPVLLLMLLAACQSGSITPEGGGKTPVCGVANPIQDLPWLKAAIEESSGKTDYCTPWSVTQGRYQGQTVYLVSLSGALCCDIPGNSVYDCQGELVFAADPAKEAKIKDKKVVWQKQ